ncbi:hypothetical protein BC941DRAFT_396406 [Chlamydoabsidia padenii]|nr:hypothetical protein BC941DRAFT_396406 [Chlamydoabsidia padenii]
MFTPTPQHSNYIRSLYKRIICEAGYFFDDRARTFVVNRARKLFKEYKTCQDESRIKNKLLEARKRLHRLEKANQGDPKSALKILEAAYGKTGKTRHKLMHCYLYENYPAELSKPAPLIPHIPHTAPPPPLCRPLQSLVTEHLGKRLEPVLPTSPYKPLHRGRQANLLWRWRSFLIQHLDIPPPFEIVCELELKAGATPDHPCFAGILSKGGARWDDMYGRFDTDPDLAHLCPTSKLVPVSRFIRHTPLPPSPFMAPPSVYAVSTLVDQSPVSLLLPPHHRTTMYQYSPRQLRRLYRRLLDNIPMLSPLPVPTSLHDSSIKYKVSRSQWITNSVTKVLDPESLPPT